VGRLSCSTSLDGGDISQLAQGWVFLESSREVRGPTPLQRWVTEANLVEARRWSLDPQLRSSDATIEDFENAVNNAAAAAELSWTQIV
jgi:hypothetical protein